MDVRETLGSSGSHAMGFQFWASESIKKTNTDGSIVGKKPVDLRTTVLLHYNL